MKRNALPIPGQPARLDEPLAAPVVLHAQSHMDREWQIRRLFAGLATPTLQIATVDCPTLMASENRTPPTFPYATGLPYTSPLTAVSKRGTRRRRPRRFPADSRKAWVEVPPPLCPTDSANNSLCRCSSPIPGSSPNQIWFSAQAAALQPVDYFPATAKVAP